MAALAGLWRGRKAIVLTKRTMARSLGGNRRPSNDDAAGDTGADAPAAELISLSDDDFKTELARVIPQLRAFGRSLSGNRDLADDLVQETLMKAWAARKRFQAGTNMRA